MFKIISLFIDVEATYILCVYCRDVYCMLLPRVVIDPISVISCYLS